MSLVIDHPTSTVYQNGQRRGFIPRVRYCAVIDFIMASGGVSWSGREMTPTPRRGLKRKVADFILSNLQK